ncbi:MAG: hypothetical protein IKN49_02585 [Elusimicrobiaceae bacterium]|nr:hypothetical protein [Elusimicrobiaceae bacterium]
MKKYVLMLLGLALLSLGVQAAETSELKNVPALEYAFESGDQDEFIAFQIRVIKNNSRPNDAFESADSLFNALIKQAMYMEATASDKHQASDLKLFTNSLINVRKLHTKFVQDLKRRHSDMQALLYQLEDFASNYTTAIKKVEEISHQAGVHLDFEKVLRDIIDHNYQLENEGTYCLSSLADKVERHFMGTTEPTWITNGSNFYKGLDATY